VAIDKTFLADSIRLEESRIQEAYERRPAASERCSRFDPGHLFTMQQLERRMLAAIRNHGFAPLHSRSILEVGCGNGHWVREFVKWGASPENLTGIDLLEGRVTQARKLCPPGLKIQRANAAKLTFADASFDIVLQVFTSILDPYLRKETSRRRNAPAPQRGRPYPLVRPSRQQPGGSSPTVRGRAF
jgi:SAM-dependent methyltransferase